MRKNFTPLLIATDFIMSSLAWASFFYFRKIVIEEAPFEINAEFVLGTLLIPMFWVILHALLGTYINTLRLYRMRILSLTALSSLIGTVVIFFVFLLDDEINSHHLYYKSLLAVFTLQFTYSILPRFILVNWVVKKIHAGKIGFNTLLIGGSQKAVDIYEELTEKHQNSGNKFIGFINLNGIDKKLEEKLPYLGHFNDIDNIIANVELEEVIIALDSTEHEKLRKIIAKISGRDLKIKVIPDMYDILSGSVKMNNIFGAPLIELNSQILPIWQRVIKRGIDIVCASVAFVLLIPVYLTLSILVKTSSEGPIFFRQERIGKNGVPFMIIKFRTMYMDAEKAGPQLSSSHDPRITKIGRIMRKMRLDEFPQFWNVIVGDMSLVGPRPERQFFIDKIIDVEPQFTQLNKVRPGITSWGQVKYGYAENVNEMIQRMKYDLLYLKNMSIALDFKIMLYTILIVFKAKGK